MCVLRVIVRLFAGYKERVGSAEVIIALPDDASVGDLAGEMRRRYPDLVDNSVRLVAAVNHEYRDHSYALKDGDEVALIPPVSGGKSD